MSHRPGAERTGYHGGANWATWPINQRCRIVGNTRFELASLVVQFTRLSRTEQRVDDAETVASELFPLCDALRWITTHGAKTLADRKVGWKGRPVWMWGVHSVVQRVPLGRVLILGTWNYPLLLPGVQMAQALAAGNEVWLKPAEGTEAVSAELVRCFHRSGVPETALRLLDSSPQAAMDAQSKGVDLVVLTGSAATGKKVMHQAADTLTPSIMELSGVDAAVVLPGAKLNRVIDAVAFGLLFNSGATCIGPRRLMVSPSEQTDLLVKGLTKRLKAADAVTVHPAAREEVARLVQDAIHCGATDLTERFDGEKLLRTGRMHPVMLNNVPGDHAVLSSDIFAPVISIVPVKTKDDAVKQINECPYRLAASVFGPTAEAGAFAKRLNVGVVTVNDMVAPTADPRLPFGGRGQSGFGVTRGPEGLLAMTTTRVIATRKGKTAMHLSPRNDADAELLSAALQWTHGSKWSKRKAALKRLTSAAGKWRALKKK
ncbi:aldehyde dehydrogenase family protein [Rhodopirellula halodulae]|uniref:aldehyde dehydrogenase family protein n=1 Tax=Rhodopirellula halodulae TaxID=2894198 RepID=UPI001E320852|nr:aldehyde dehydrogenase family protein [Rhodopirellula sp. JC737]MCC9656012.1 aldehyde dehydrogenase family protein [Rhodopirellula sp. JC737]